VGTHAFFHVLSGLNFFIARAMACAVRTEVFLVHDARRD
jgi:hypothetical protein